METNRSFPCLVSNHWIDYIYVFVSALPPLDNNLFLCLSDMALNIEGLLDAFPVRERDAERKQVKKNLFFTLKSSFPATPCPKAVSHHGRWSSWCGRTTQSWGPSTGSTADSVSRILRSTSPWWHACSSGACSKTATSTITASLWPRSTVSWQVSVTISSKMPDLPYRTMHLRLHTAVFACGFVLYVFTPCVSQTKPIQQRSTLRSVQFSSAGSFTALWWWPTMSSIST